MKKAMMNILKGIIIIIILIATAFLVKFAYAKYMSSLSGNSTADIAKWNFKVIDGIPKTKDVLDFAITRTDTNKHVAERTVSTTEQVENF